MKNYILLLSSLLIFSCTDAKKNIIVKKKNIIKNDSIEIAYGSVPRSSIDIDTLIAAYHDYNYNEKIKLKVIYGDTTKFIYYYKNYMQYTDTLIIYKPDSLKLRALLKFISKRTINFKGKPLLVKKYRQEKDPYIYANVYINDSLGLILRRFLSHPSGEDVILYNTDKFSELQNAVINDSVFFAGELLD